MASEKHNIPSDACEPGLELSSDTGPLTQANSPAGDVSTCSVSAPLESGENLNLNQLVNARTPALDLLSHAAVSKFNDGDSKKQVADDTCGDKKDRIVTRFFDQVSDRYKHLLRFFLCQRCPWLVPILEMRDVTDVPFEYFEVISPAMPGRRLENLMEQGMVNTKQDVRKKAISIAYQISEGISFLHSRNVVHGDINSSNVLFDRYGNARLTNYGMYTAYCAEDIVLTRQLDASHRTGFVEFINADKCFTHDLWHFASLFLQFLNSDQQSQQAAMSYLTESLSGLKKMRKSCSTPSTVEFQWKEETLLIQESFDYKSFTQNSCIDHASGTSLEVKEEKKKKKRTKLKESADKVLVSKSFNCRDFIKSYIDDKRTWRTDGITFEIVHVLIKCLWMRCDRSTASEMTADMRSIMKQMHLPRVFDDQNSEICRYCTAAPIHSELRLRRTECPETCPFLRACSSCMPSFGLCHMYNADHLNSDSVENVCPDHGCKHGDGLDIDCVENICPIHQCTIEPMIGGQKAYAMILNDDVGKDDAMKMLQLAIHPKIMQMPCSNVFRITIRDSKKCISHVSRKMKQILGGNPTYFLFYYSGHEMVLADSKQEVRPEYAQLVQILSHFITEISKVCPRFLKMFDCCYAAAVAELFEVKLDDDAHVEWHASWVSSKRNQLSNIDVSLGHQLSRFTKLVVSSLQGGTEAQCPIQLEMCNDCLTFKKSLVANDCVVLYDAAEVVRKHAHIIQHKNQSGPSDAQNPVFGGTFRDKPYISFFNKEPKLYTVFVEDMADGTIHAYSTDSFHATDIWRMTQDHHSKEAHKVEFYERYSKQLCIVYLSDKDMHVGPIRDVLSKDNNCLLVKFDDTPAQVEAEDDEESSASQTEDDVVSSASQN